MPLQKKKKPPLVQSVRICGCQVAFPRFLLSQYGLNFRGSIWLMGALDNSQQSLLGDYLLYWIHGPLLAAAVPVAPLFKLGVDRPTWPTLERLVIVAHLGMWELGSRAAWPPRCEAPELQAGNRREGSLSLIREGITSKHRHATY